MDHEQQLLSDYRAMDGRAKNDLRRTASLLAGLNPELPELAPINAQAATSDPERPAPLASTLK